MLEPQQIDRRAAQLQGQACACERHIELGNTMFMGVQRGVGGRGIVLGLFLGVLVRLGQYRQQDEGRKGDQLAHEGLR